MFTLFINVSLRIVAVGDEVIGRRAVGGRFNTVPKATVLLESGVADMVKNPLLPENS